MNNLNTLESTFTGFKPWKLGQDQPDNFSGHGQTKIVKRLPFWINNQPYWTYQCKCCKAYRFEKGKTNPGWGGIYE